MELRLRWHLLEDLEQACKPLYAPTPLCTSPGPRLVIPERIHHRLHVLGNSARDVSWRADAQYHWCRVCGDDVPDTARTAYAAVREDEGVWECDWERNFLGELLFGRAAAGGAGVLVYVAGEVRGVGREGIRGEGVGVSFFFALFY